MNRVDNNSIIIYAVLGVIIIVAGFVFIPPLIRKLSGKTYKKMAKVSEEDFANNGPQIVRKSEKEEKPNDD